MWSSQSRSLCRYSQNSATRSAPGNVLPRTAATPGLVAGSAFPPLPDGQTGPAAALSSGEGENCQETEAPREGTIPARSEHPILRVINRWPLGQGVGPAQCGCLGGSSQGPFWHQHLRGTREAWGQGRQGRRGPQGQVGNRVGRFRRQTGNLGKALRERESSQGRSESWWGVRYRGCGGGIGKWAQRAGP